ncbi:hypothetical protein Trydic_g15617 [Trypoxylus dichotomus]
MAYTRVSLLAVLCVLVGIFAARRIPKERWVIEEDRCRTPDGDDGFCVGIKDCKIIYNIIEKSVVNDALRETLGRYHCGSPDDVTVCCPSNSTLLLNLVTSTNDSNHPNVKLLPSACGLAGSVEKITNGNATALFEFPWAVALKYDRPTNSWSCGGSLINDHYILTAAHCIRSQYKLIAVRLGEHNFDTDPDCEVGLSTDCADPPQDFEVSIDDAIVHPGYSTATLQNDIALIRLRQPANTTVYSVGPVCLPLTESEKLFHVRNYTVIGWGATETGLSSRILLKVFVPKVNNTECAPKYASRAKLSDNQLCAGGKNEQDSCPGDSGGPLTGDYVSTDSIRTVQYGIVSFGPKICGRVDFPAVYTRVDKYLCEVRSAPTDIFAIIWTSGYVGGSRRPGYLEYDTVRVSVAIVVCIRTDCCIICFIAGIEAIAAGRENAPIRNG